MNSDFVDVSNALLNLDTEKELEDGSAYRLQNTAGGKNWCHSDLSDSVYIVISDSEPAGREAAMKSAIILSAGGDPYEHNPKAGFNAWAFAPFGDSSLSILPIMMGSARG